VPSSAGSGWLGRSSAGSGPARSVFGWVGAGWVGLRSGRSWLGKRLPKQAEFSPGEEEEPGWNRLLGGKAGASAVRALARKALTKPIARSVSPNTAQPQDLSRTLLPERDIPLLAALRQSQSSPWPVLSQRQLWTQSAVPVTGWVQGCRWIPRAISSLGPKLLLKGGPGNTGPGTAASVRCCRSARDVHCSVGPSL
jgi:hypothetical protein